ncbi:lipoyl(octanoyl) transferase [Pelagibacterium luteolum]|uniref:Octanoyltransferase n=2 Tax=Pelagibacterium luteolum TaxID=440168 RepID=A0A1G7X5B6_9HYPH|nr:lipoyl(octanoyl) transferase [Pelagibacterium luteolum]
MSMVSEALSADGSQSCASARKLVRADEKPANWFISEQLVSYPDALETMRTRARAIADGEAGEAIWLVEHPPLYTAGTSARAEDLLAPDRFPVFEAGRGGQFTYHGPGQRVVYVMLDLRERGRDVRCLVSGLENWVIDTLAAFNIKGEKRDGRIGVWVKRPDKGPLVEDKIAAIGVRVSRWASFHGISLNISPDLGHYSGIVPCGITQHGVTSFEDLGQLVSMPEVDSALQSQFERHFGPVRLASTL